MALFVIRSTSDGTFFFVLEREEGQSLMTSPAYPNFYACKSAIPCIKNSVPHAGIIEEMTN